ncbi:hypothetical protein HW555_003470 [Spodoptera exigua]|uniref:Uncharacterized protein n=1 Tax=Spodoptera exigua TaxID=7107 RepID=A0A835GLZ3_SPOEX|nr:hypothetical protein HW555_003470 [Spodoptera exigua]
MLKITLLVFVALLCTVLCQPLDLHETTDVDSNAVQHHVSRRFVNPMFALGGGGDSSVTKMRTKRHKENAKLWDHQARSIADCNERFGDCYE